MTRCGRFIEDFQRRMYKKNDERNREMYAHDGMGRKENLQAKGSDADCSIEGIVNATRTK